MCTLNRCSCVLQDLEILGLSAVISTDIMFYFGMTRINGPNLFVVILFEIEGGG